MANVRLTCFVPSNKPLSSNELAVELFLSLAIDLQRLHKSLNHNSPFLRWCSEAMRVVKKTHAHFLHSFQASKDPASLEGSCMLDEYMRATLYLLDLCNLIKSAASSLDRYRMMIDFTVNRLKGATFATATSKMELQRLEIEKSNYLVKFKKCREMKIVNNNNNNNNNNGVSNNVKLKTKPLMHVLQPIWNTMSTIPLFVFCSIIHSVPIKTDHEVGFMASDLFADSVQGLNVTFGETFRHVQDKGKPVLYETQMIEEAFAAIREEIVSGKEVSEGKGKLPAESLEKLKNRSAALKDGIDLFESDVNELFEDLIKGRKKMIDLIKINNHITYC